MSALDASSDPPRTVPLPPVPGTPIAGTAVFALRVKLLSPADTSDSGLRMLALATCPTTNWLPLEYCARIWPPFTRLICVRFAAGEPSCDCAEVADGCANCVILGLVPLKRFQLMLMLEAPSAKPETARVGA